MDPRFTEEQLAAIRDKALSVRAEQLEQEQAAAAEAAEQIRQEYRQKYQAMINYWQTLVSPELLLLAESFEDYARMYSGEETERRYLHIRYNDFVFHLFHRLHEDGAEYCFIRNAVGLQEAFTSAAELERATWLRIGALVASEQPTESKPEVEVTEAE